MASGLKVADYLLVTIHLLEVMINSLLRLRGLEAGLVKYILEPCDWVSSFEQVVPEVLPF